MLTNLINEHALADAKAGKWEAVATKLNALTTPVPNPTLWSFGLMMSHGHLPRELVTGIATAVKEAAKTNPLMDSAFIAFSTTGLHLHTEDRQAMIDELGVGLPAEAVAAVKGLGVRHTPVIVTTADACKEAYTSAQRESELDAFQKRFDTIKNQWRTSEQPQAEAALRAMADEWKVN